MQARNDHSHCTEQCGVLTRTQPQESGYETFDTMDTYEQESSPAALTDLQKKTQTVGTLHVVQALVAADKGLMRRSSCSMGDMADHRYRVFSFPE